MNETANLGVKTGKSARRKASRPASPRSRARELALQGLYQWRVGGADAATVESHMPQWAVCADGDKPKESEAGEPEPAASVAEVVDVDSDFYLTLVRGVIRDSAVLTDRLAPTLDRAFDALSPVEAVILLIAAFELIHCPETPYRVIINEAIELAKRFGGNEGHRYVNGVLDKAAGFIRGQETEDRNS
ncbi:MAG: transcription antitermination factor NusB [Zoogloeaceae bacterium]|jgi:N utilization substance protein B|nr:transcription antitermination factor NusB [Zoogloeaceae bacterium]